VIQQEADMGDGPVKGRPATLVQRRADNAAHASGCGSFIVRLSRRSAEDVAVQPCLRARRLATRSVNGGWAAK
jgi:hypothetical protein